MTQENQIKQMNSKRHLFQSTFVVSGMTATSRVTGFLRDLVFAHIFGAAADFDAFLAAFRIPNFLRRIFAEGAFSQAFIPVLSEYGQQQSQEEMQLFLNRMAGSLALVLFCVTAIVVIATPWLVWIFFPGFIKDLTRYELATTMLRITAPYILFISFTAYAGGILNSYGKFAIPSFTPNILNLALIGTAIFMAPYFDKPVVALAWGVFIGGAMQLLFQLPFLYRLDFLPKPQLCWSDPGVKKVLQLMLPAVLGASATQVSLLVDNFLASFLRPGSLSWFYYADRLTSLPLGMFGVAIATVVLPHLARRYAANSPHEFSREFDWALKLVLLIALPATVAMILLSAPIVITLFQYKKFFIFDVFMTQYSLIAFAFGIPSFMLVKVLASGFYSQQDVKTPVRIATVVMIANIILATLFIFPLAHAGLALATTMTSTLNAVLLFKLLCRNKFYCPSDDWKVFWVRLLGANGVMALFLWMATADIALWFSWNWFGRVWHLSLLCVVAAVIYFVCLSLSGLKLREFKY